MTPATMTAPKNGNGEQTTLAQNTGPLAVLRKYIANADVKARLAEMLGDRADTFANSIINVVGGSDQLKACDPATVMQSAMKAASVDLAIDPALGFAAIVPYKGKAQFQVMTKGLIQLAIRSGQYKRIWCNEVYRDELKSHNPITGETEFHAPETYKMRNEKRLEDVVGYYAWFRLHSGFECYCFITHTEAMAHGRKFSKAYQYDISQGRQSSIWSTDPVAMGKKTCMKMLLGRYGILSIKMQEAFIAESDDFAGGPQRIESTIIEPENVGGVEGLKSRMMQQGNPAENDAGAGEGETAQDQTKPAAEPSPTSQEAPKADPTPTPAPVSTDAEGKQSADPTHLAAGNAPSVPSKVTAPTTPSAEKPKTNGKTMYRCKDDDCESKGTPFDNPTKVKRGPKAGTLICPHCAGENIEIVTENQQDVDPNAFDTPPTAADVQAATGGVVTCPASHVVERSKLIKSAVVGKNGLGLCPTCKNNGNTTIVREGN